MPSRRVTSATPRRRSSDEVRALIEDTARRLFADHGYEDVSTRQIAQDAGVTQAAIFRHFGTKEGLFEAVAIQPLTVFCERFAEIWSDPAVWQASDNELTLTYVRELAALVRSNRPVFALLAGHLAADRQSGPRHAAGALLDEHLREFTRVVVENSADRSRTMDLDVAVRFTIALVLGVTIYGDVLFEGTRPGDDLAAEIAAYVIRGAQVANPAGRSV